MDNIELILEDCLDFMRGMKDGSIDWVITDPPYGIGENSKKNSSRGNLAVSRDYGDGFWDKKLTKEYIDEILRVSQNQILWGGAILRGLATRKFVLAGLG